ncbi:7845_t:CDS:2 [Scutellospora calospora]|uniref:7845_t:CDS:1 n=1 Tax=Scutellospora calospora TaxID=85575 RepID=A0ACA9L6I6_9GLOM|nr:7845_t:CDS:2 [Scutellospora calospora]
MNNHPNPFTPSLNIQTNLLRTEQPNPVIQIFEPGVYIPLENLNLYDSTYNNSFISIQNDRGYHSDSQLPSTDPVDVDNGYLSDSQYITPQLPYDFFSINSQLLQTSSNETNDDFSDYLSDNYESSLSASPQSPYPFYSNINAIRPLELDSQPVRRERRKKYVTTACSNCRASHAKCSNDFPCERCKEKGISDSCKFTENKRRGRKPRSTPSTPEPTTPDSFYVRNNANTLNIYEQFTNSMN